jgi:hypothetical protein
MEGDFMRSWGIKRDQGKSKKKINRIIRAAAASRQPTTGTEERYSSRMQETTYRRGIPTPKVRHAYIMNQNTG